MEWKFLGGKEAPKLLQGREDAILTIIYTPARKTKKAENYS